MVVAIRLFFRSLASKWLGFPSITPIPAFLFRLSFACFWFCFIFCFVLLVFFRSLLSHRMIRLHLLLFNGIVLIEFRSILYKLQCVCTSVHICICTLKSMWVCVCGCAHLLTHIVFAISTIQMNSILKSMQLTKEVISSKSEQEKWNSWHWKQQN